MGSPAIRPATPAPPFDSMPLRWKCKLKCREGGLACHPTCYISANLYAMSLRWKFELKSFSSCHGPNIYKDTKPKMSAFLKNLLVKVLGGRCLSMWGPLPPRFLFGVVKQFCRFGIWSNTQCNTPEYAFHISQSPPPCYTLFHLYLGLGISDKKIIPRKTE